MEVAQPPQHSQKPLNLRLRIKGIRLFNKTLHKNPLQPWSFLIYTVTRMSITGSADLTLQKSIADLNVVIQSAQCSVINPSPRRLVVFDMDSTLIKQEVIDELAREYNVYNQIAPITESAMRGEIDFDQSLRMRVALLKGAPATIIDDVKARIVFSDGALQLCQALQRLGVIMAVVSGGFLPLALHVQQHLGLDYAFANTLEIKDEILTGNVVGEIVNADKKAFLLNELAQKHGIPLSEVQAT